MIKNILFIILLFAIGTIKAQVYSSFASANGNQPSTCSVYNGDFTTVFLADVTDGTEPNVKYELTIPTNLNPSTFVGAAVNLDLGTNLPFSNFFSTPSIVGNKITLTLDLSNGATITAGQDFTVRFNLKVIETTSDQYIPLKNIEDGSVVENNTGPGPFTPIVNSGNCLTAANDGSWTVSPGGTTPSVFANDTSSFGMTPNTTPDGVDTSVSLTNLGGLTGATINTNGTINVPSSAAPGTYNLTYQICSPEGTTTCTTATATIVIPAVVGQSDLSITKSVNNTYAAPGSNVTFTVTAKNNGPDNSSNTTVNDLLPAGFVFVSATPSVGTYNSSTGVWNIGTLNNGATATLTMVATVIESGSHLNVATISGTNTDPNAFNNTANAAVTLSSGCTDEPFQIANNNVATYHAGATRASNGLWYAWGEEHGDGGVPPRIVNNSNFSNVPSGAIVKFVSGGSQNQLFNQLVALVDNATSTDYRIVNLSTKTGIVMSGSSLNLPTNAANNQILTKDVSSFYAGNDVIAIVANGRAYIYSRVASTHLYGDNFTTGADGWGKSVKTATGIEITDFVSVRGDTEDHTGAFIGFTSSGKVYGWGHLVPDGAGGYTTQNYAIDITPTPTVTTAKPILVGANYDSSNTGVFATFYTLFNNGEFYAIGAGEKRQLGDFGTLNSTTWKRVLTDDSPVTYANVVYFSTEEHDATADNRASVSMILANKELWAFGSNDDGLLGIAGGLSGNKNPTIAKYNSSGTNLSLLGTTPENTALSVEMGGHISFIIRSIGGKAYMSIAGHGSNGSLLGVNDTNYYDVYSASEEIKFANCFASTACYKIPTSGTGLATNHGITALGRAGAETSNNNWPMVRKGAWTVLESKTKGFVINRVANPETAIANPVEGMMVYDTNANCLKVYFGTTAGWSCLDNKSCGN